MPRTPDLKLSNLRPLALVAALLLALGLGGAPAVAQEKQKEPPKPHPEVQRLLDQGQNEKLGPEERLPIFEKALAEARRLGDRTGEGESLFWLGYSYDLVQQYPNALEHYEQALSIGRELGDRKLEATTLNNIGFVYSDLRQPANALEYFEQALSLLREVGDSKGEAQALGNIGYAFLALRQPTKALEHYEQARSIYRDVGDAGGEAHVLNNSAAVYHDLGQPAKALEHFEQVLSIGRELGDRKLEATTLHNIGALYRHLGQPVKALEHYEQALLILRETGNRGGEAFTLNNLGTIYTDLGQLAKALEYLGQALPIWREVGDREGVAMMLSNIGSIYQALGLLAKALEHYEQALPMFREVLHHRGEATVLNNIGTIYAHLGQLAKALEYGEKSFAVYIEAGLREGQASALNNIGSIHERLNQRAKALEFYEQALSIRREVGNRGGEAGTLNDIGRLYFGLGQPAKALEHLEKALPITREVGDRSGEANILNSIVIVYEGLGKIKLAAALGRQEMNVRHSLQQDMDEMGSSERRAFADTLSGSSLQLSRILGGLSRADALEQVLASLYSDRPDPVPATPFEELFSRGYEERINAFVPLGAKIQELWALGERRTPEQQAELDALLRERERLEEEFSAWFERVAEESKSLKPEDNVVSESEASRAMDAALAGLPAGSAAVYAIPDTDKVHLLVVNQGGRREIRTVEAKDLEKKVSEFKIALASPRYDPRPLGKELYEILVKPIEDLLPAGSTPLAPLLTHDHREEGGAVVMWTLVGELRGIPLGALHDGERYLAETRAYSTFTPGFVSHLPEEPRATGEAAVFGSTRALETKDPITEMPISFSALPGVQREAEAIAPALGASPALDQSFTKEALLKALEAKPRILHLASHFHLEPGDDRRSFLLTGDGGTLTVEEVKSLREELFEALELVVLSACGTAVGQSATGAEAESFAAWMQRKGAKAVISTLWPVEDQSTALIMAEFYRLRKENPEMTKLEALRQAQLKMIRNELGFTPAGDRGESRAPQADGLPLWPKDQPLASHPYYWAPFQLTGNWK
jgi:CHAT domain-containing protein/Tfp pilus assembly protein PilF